MHIASISVAIISTLVAARLCLAQPADEAAMARSQAKELSNTAEQRRAAGDLRGALDLYKKAYAIYSSAYLLWPQAELYLLTDKPVEARDTLLKHEQGFPAGTYPPGEGTAEIHALRDRIAAREAVLRAAPATRAQVARAPLELNMQRESAAPRPLLRKVGWVALGGAALLLAGGGVALGVREQQLGVWNDDATCLTGGLMRQDNCGDHFTTANRAQDAAIATFVIGGALAGSAAALLIISHPRAESRAAAAKTTGALQWTCAPVSAQVGVYCVGIF